MDRRCSTFTDLRLWNCCSNGRAECPFLPTLRRGDRWMRPTARIIRQCSRARRARWQRRLPLSTSRRGCSKPCMSEASAARPSRSMSVPVTFLPVKSERIDEHKMHAEWGRIDGETAERLNCVRRSGGRLISVGTTSLRLLESAANPDGVIQPFEGDTASSSRPGIASSRRWPDYELPPAALDPVHASQCVDGARAYERGLRPCH